MQLNTADIATLQAYLLTNSSPPSRRNLPKQFDDENSTSTAPSCAPAAAAAPLEALPPTTQLRHR